MTLRSPRVLVTGIGAVTPLGPDLESTMTRLRAGESGLAPTSALDGRQRWAGIARDFEPKPHFRTAKGLKVCDRKTQLAVAAAAQAMHAARFPEGEVARCELAVVLGCAVADLEVDKLGNAVAPDAAGQTAADVRLFAERSLRRLYPLWLLVNLPNMLSAQVAIQLEASGPSYTVMTEELAGLQAIGEGYELIRDGVVEAAVVGGAESPLTPFCFACLARGDGAFANGAPVLGEGSAALVLESEAHAQRRDAPVIAEITGFAVRAAPSSAGPSATSGSATAPPAMARATRASLSAAGEPTLGVRLVPCEVPRTDLEIASAVEAMGIASVGRPPAPLEPRFGDTLGAAGALRLVLALAADTGERAHHPPHLILCSAVGRSGAAASLAARVSSPRRSGSPTAIDRPAAGGGVAT